MKGDQASDVHCPLCPWIGHPRSGRYDNYTQTALHVERASLRQHFMNAHPLLGCRQRTLLLDAVIPLDGGTQPLEYPPGDAGTPCSLGNV